MNFAIQFVNGSVTLGALQAACSIITEPSE
jgi:hypothetical protein